MRTSLAAEPLLALAVTVTSEQRVDSVLQSIVQGLASQPGVALARIWLLPSAVASFRHAVSEPPDYLCLVASAGTPINSPGEDWCFLQGRFARMRFNVGKVGQVAASRHPILVKDVTAQNDWVVRPEWAKREGIRSFAGHPLIFRDKLLGVIGVFSREPLGQQEFTWLGLFANQAAVAIANARAEEALQTSERNLAAIINTIPTTAWTARPDGYCDFLNQVWLDYAGLTEEQAQGWGWAEAIHPDDRKKLVDVWQSSLASGTPVDTEARIRRFDGSYRWFLIRANPLRDESGNILKWYGTCIDIDDRKKVEEALQSSERNLSLIINAIPALIHTARPDGYLDYFNQRWLQYLGCSLCDVEGWKWTTWIHPDDLQGIVDKWQACLASGEIFEYETRVRRGDGQYRWMFHRKVPLRDGQGNIVRWYGTSLDIEDRKRAEWLLAAEMRTLQMITEGGSLTDILNHVCTSIDLQISPWITSILLMDPDGKRLWPSAGPRVPEGWARAITPLPVAADTGLCGTAAFLKTRVISPNVGIEPILREEYRAIALKNGIGAGWSQPILTKDHQVLGTFAVYSPEPRVPTSQDLALTEAAGRIVLLAIERQRSLEQLRRSEAFLAEGQNLARMGNFSWIVATDEIRWSEQIYRIFEFEPGVPVTFELIGSRVHPEDLDLMYDMIGKAQRAVSDYEYEHRLLMPDGSIKYLHLIAHANRDHKGRLEYIGAVQDVTESKLAEEALNRARSELAHVARLTTLNALTASIAHEVNQPLSGIITNASTCLRMLNGDTPNIDGARETARRTIRDCNRASDVIWRLRALYSKKEFTSEQVDLNEATREVVALSLSDLQRNRVILQSELADDLPPVTGDRIQLQQVILNLLRNASDAMSAVDGRPRELLIRTEREEGDRVRVTVKDAGVGFTPEAAAKLFQPFYTTKRDGMGIGLSVSHSIIEAHQGRLWATANDGPGATFSFALPCRAGGSAGMEAAVDRSDPAANAA